MEFYFRQGLRPATQKTYNSAKRRYLQFCIEINVDPLPLTEPIMCRYVSYLGNQGLAHKSIKAYLSALHHLAISYKLPDPKISNMAYLHQVLRGIRSEHAKRRPGNRKRLPITPELLLKLRQVWERQACNIDHIMLWAAATLCFFGFLRAGEITVPSEKDYDPGVHLNAEDIAVDSVTKPSRMRVRIKASKTDPFRNGVDVFLGSTGNALCPIAAMLARLAACGPRQGFLFQFANGRYLSRERFVIRVREALQTAGVDCKSYSGHSFRIGAATTAARQGISDATIQILGRWESTAYMLYIQTPREQLTSVSATISHTRN